MVIKSLLAVLSLLLASELVKAETMNLAFFRSPPYSEISEDGQPIGMEIEVAQTLGRELNLQINPVICPLARCLLMMKEGSADLILGLIKNADRQKYMSFIDPPYYKVSPAFAFYKLKDRDIRLATYKELQRYDIAVTRGAAYFERFDQDTSLSKIESISIDKLIELLLKERVDLVIGVESTLDTTLTAMGVETAIDKVEFHAESPIEGYMALSKRSKFVSRIDSFSDAIIRLRGSGELQKILAKYNVRDISNIE